MPLNISNLDEAQLKGQARFNNYYKGWQDRWTQPITEANIVMAMHQIDQIPGATAYLEKNAPQAMADLKNRILPKGG
jgi:hypothetical protein